MGSRESVIVHSVMPEVDLADQREMAVKRFGREGAAAGRHRG